jgi:hypothetical protein
MDWIVVKERAITTSERRNVRDMFMMRKSMRVWDSKCSEGVG